MLSQTSYKEGYTCALLHQTLELHVCIVKTNKALGKNPFKELYVNHHDPEIYRKNCSLLPKDECALGEKHEGHNLHPFNLHPLSSPINQI